MHKALYLAAAVALLLTGKPQTRSRSCFSTLTPTCVLDRKQLTGGGHAHRAGTMHWLAQMDFPFEGSAAFSSRTG